MAVLLEESAVDLEQEQVDAVLTAAEEAEALAAFPPLRQDQQVQDLSHGGMMNGVRVTPMSAGKKLQRGRPSARQAWMWNGSESLLTLAWNPEGTRHDGGRHYLLKRHCLCCGASGFTGARCTSCAKNSCTQCASGMDRSKTHTFDNGKTVQGWVIPVFYLRKEDVPIQARFYGSINCFLESCPRRGGRGFLTEPDMRLHARNRHTTEYQAHMESAAASRTDQMDAMQQQLNALLAERIRQPANQAKMARVRAAKRKPAKATA